MKWSRLASLAAVAAGLWLSSTADASFSYSTSLTITSVSGPDGSGVVVNTPGVNAVFTSIGGTKLTLTDVSRTGFNVPSNNTINIGDLAVTTTAGSPGETFSVFYTDVFTLTNNPPPGSAAVGSFTITGRLDLANVSTGSGTVTNTYFLPDSASGVLGGIHFSGAADNFGNPTINGRAGNLGGTIMAVPEPSSIALVGIGSLGVAGLSWRRARRNGR